LESKEKASCGGKGVPTHEECHKEIQRVLHSTCFRNASTLQQLLQYLTLKANDPDGETLKEYTIGVEAFKRPQDFDPKTDTIVRVQLHRLRQKLKEYYDFDGIYDPVLIDIPKGHYLPIFEHARAAEERSGDEDSTELANVAPTNGNGREHGLNGDEQKVEGFGKKRGVFAMIVAGCALASFAAGILVTSYWFRDARRNQAAAAKSQNFEASSDPVQAFWASFLSKDPTPVIAYPDAVFLADTHTDLFRFRHGATDFRGAPVDSHLAQQFASDPALVSKAGQLYYENSYLGFGELQAVGMLSNLFGEMGMKPIIKPSRELTVDDLKQHNVIMLGSSSQNLAVADLSFSGDFKFMSPNPRPVLWKNAIVNDNPRPNEASIYQTERDPRTQILKTDYGLITIQPGVIPGRYIAVLGGLDTTGSEGAVLFTTSRQGIEELKRSLKEIRSPAWNPFPTFQALLQVRLEKGYDVLGASLLTLHPIPSAHTETAESAHSSAAPN
jgi:hypothetical protein